MSETFFAAAYWGPRAESVDECVQRLTRCWQELASVQPSLATWLRQGSSPAQARTPISTTAPALRALLLAGRNRADTTGEVIEDLGYRISAWNGGDVTFSSLCGQHNARLLNNAMLDIPGPGGQFDALYDPSTARRLLGALVNAYEPDWATFRTDTLAEAQPRPLDVPGVGWLTYVKSGPHRPYLTTVAGETFAQGRLFQTGQSVDTATTEAVLKLRAELADAGCLTSTP